MKNLLTLSLLLLTSIAINAQEVTENTMPMAYGTHNAVLIEIPLGDVKEVEDLWRDYAKDKYDKPKKVRRSDEYVMENVRIPEVNGIKDFNLYSRVAPIATNSHLIVWAELDADSYLNSEEHPEKYSGLVKVLQDFRYYVKMHTATTAVEEQEDVLSDLEKELEKLKKENEKLHDVIEKAKEDIIDAEKEIVENEANQKELERQLEAQLKNVEKVRAKKMSLKKDNDGGK